MQSPAAAKTELRLIPFGIQGEHNMLATIALILIILWLLGFFAFHVTSGLLHVVLVVGIIVLILHFVRGRSGS